MLDGCVLKELDQRLLYPAGQDWQDSKALLSLANDSGGTQLFYISQLFRQKFYIAGLNITRLMTTANISITRLEVAYKVVKFGMKRRRKLSLRLTVKNSAGV